MTALDRPRLLAKPFTAEPSVLTRSDLVAATAAWLVMTAVFWFGSQGHSLRVTFVPGVALAYAVALWIWRTGRPLPTARAGLPLFFVALAVQFLHFAEENATDFVSRFPAIYGGQPYDATIFVTFNMVAYAVFAVAAIGLWCFDFRKLAVPVIFFCVYGTFGNACSHLLWAVQSGQYFPGLYTSLLYWILGPALINRFLGRKSWTMGFLAGYLTMTLLLLTLFQTQTP